MRAKDYLSKSKMHLEDLLKDETDKNKRYMLAVEIGQCEQAIEDLWRIIRDYEELKDYALERRESLHRRLK